jgi:hypothetical protein
VIGSAGLAVGDFACRLCADAIGRDHLTGKRLALRVASMSVIE